MPPARPSEREMEREMQLLDDPIRIDTAVYMVQAIRGHRVSKLKQPFFVVKVRRVSLAARISN